MRTLKKTKGTVPFVFLRRLPVIIYFLFFIFVVFILANALYRIIFLILFMPGNISLFSPDMVYASYLGMKFDLRLSAIIVLPLLFMSYFIGDRLIKKGVIRQITAFYLTLCIILLFIFFGVDIATYSYIRNRVSSALFMFLDTPDISFTMIYQSYPVVSIFILLVVITSGFYLFIIYIIKKFSEFRKEKIKKTGLFFIYLFFSIGLFGVIYGRIARFPLRWSEAYFTTDGFISNYTFNPVLYFYDSLKVKPHNYDLERAEKGYQVLAEFLNVEGPVPKESLSLKRFIDPEMRFETQPNIVVIMLETFASFKVGAMGNKLDSSPNFDRLCKEGILFTRFYVPMENTSRSIFSSFFGIPDVSIGYYSSKNPLVVEQYSILNALNDYEKLYFLGGSASWGNIRGILSYNIDDLKIYEEGSYSSPVHDVWGISDVDLFYEANLVLTGTREPFFAFIQTAGNHRPFRIPDDSRGFIEAEIDENVLAENGFYSLREYNGFRFLDHSLGYFFELAEKEGYFSNTIFIIYGDHGTNGGALDRRFGDLALASYHVPMLIYAPVHIPDAQKIDAVSSSLDMMPTIAGLTGKPYINKTLGRDLFDTASDKPRIAFTFTPFRNPPMYGLIMDNYYLNADSEGNFNLYYYNISDEYKCIRDRYTSISSYMYGLCEAVYQYSRYLLYNNKKITGTEENAYRSVYEH